jgi:tryptophan-rich sensory protein
MVAALLEGIMSGTGVRVRFAELKQPKFAPRLWAWSIVGVTYYVLFFFLLKSLLSRPWTPWTVTALALTTALLIGNAIWNWVFFRKRDLWLSFLFFVAYLLMAVTLAVVLFRLRSPLMRFYVFYPIYLAYAAWWVYSVWRLNDRT